MNKLSLVDAFLFTFGTLFGLGLSWFFRIIIVYIKHKEKTPFELIKGGKSDR